MWNGTPITLSSLATQLQQTRHMFPQSELRIQPDPQARYAQVYQTLAVIKRSGVEGMGIIGNENYARDF